MKTKTLGRWLSAALSLVLVLTAAVFPMASAYAADGVPYVDENGIAYTADNVTEVTSNDTEWNTGWYVVDSDVTNSNRIEVVGDVNLILADGYTLTASRGIGVVSEDYSLTIYGQSGGTGKLIATSSNDNNAGIGGENGTSLGSITVNGGNVSATGGDFGAGIGTGRVSPDRTGKITINGGNVYAEGGTYGAGIGCGFSTYCVDSITINGGTVEAHATTHGAGIGQGGISDGYVYSDVYNCGNIAITGGYVYAAGSNYGAGIGAGNMVGVGGTLEISGGTVVATGNASTADGIGGGHGATGPSFTTGTDGGAVIYASSINDQSDKANWSGIIATDYAEEKRNGVVVGLSGTAKVYGDPVISADEFIPEGLTAVMESGHTLNLGGEGHALTNYGTFYQNWGSGISSVGGQYMDMDNGNTYYEIVNELGCDLTGTVSYGGRIYAKKGDTVSASLEGDTTYANYTISGGADTSGTATGTSFTMWGMPVTVTAGDSITEMTIADVPVNDLKYTYSGEEQTFELAESTAYTIGNNKGTNAGTYEVTISLNEGYIWRDGTTEDKTVEFTIGKAPQDISYGTTSITRLETAHDFTNDTLTYNLSPEEGSGISYSSSNEEVALVSESGEITIDGTGETTITATAAETANYAETSASYVLTVVTPEETVTSDIEDQHYTGNDIHLYAYVAHDEIEEAEGLTYSYQWYRGDELLEGEIYEILTLSGDDVAVQEGTVYTCVVTISDEHFTDEITAEITVTIIASPLDKSMFKVDTSSEPYTGSAITKDITSDLMEGVDYTVTYSDNVSIGLVTVTIEGIGNYTGTVTYNFNIVRVIGGTTGSSSSSDENTGSTEETGEPEGEDEDSEGGTHGSSMDDDALIEAIGNIKLVARSQMSKAQGKKAVKVYWYEQSGIDLDQFEFDAYQVYRSVKRYSGFGTKPIFTTTRTTYWNTAIKTGTKYYYKVRGYKTIGDAKYYTDWSLKAWRTVR